MGILKAPEAISAIRKQRVDQQKALTALNYATRYGKNRKVKVDGPPRSKPSIWVRYGQTEKS